MVEAELINRAAAIADFTDTSVFVQEVVEEGAEAPQEWLGLNTENSEDSAKVIDSSDEGEEGEEEEEEDEEESDVDLPEVGADGQPQPDRALSNEPRTKAPTVTGDGQAGIDQPPIPPTGATDPVIQPSAIPTAAADSSAQTEPPATSGGTADSSVQPEPSAAPNGTSQTEPSAAPTGTAQSEPSAAP